MLKVKSGIVLAFNQTALTVAWILINSKRYRLHIQFKTQASTHNPLRRSTSTLNTGTHTSSNMMMQALITITCML